MRTSERSEHVYAWTIEGNPLAEDELRRVYRRLQYEPRSIGRRFKEDAPGLEHWIYESPKLPRLPRIRVYYTIDPDQRIVSIESIDLL